ncbi:ABC-three component system middle component 5 [Acinetobacter baumannii]|uniref:ABC-three component system middle component 5 n=1 Tax=Acinetobacter baumannii TaxID=470 RepID=UPI0029576645|nr:ABC-three component system middle component 5 [Acinetobacter baumannii]
MLVYNPAYDIYHCIYRLVFVLKKVNINNPIEVDRLKIIDFYLVFPYLITEIRLPREVSGVRRFFKTYSTKYRKVTNKYVTFQTMKPLQEQAIDYLCLKGYISYLNDGKITPTPLINSLNLPLRSSFFGDQANNIENNLFDFFLKYEFYGKDGLKDRTNLMEFKYDRK